MVEYDGGGAGRLVVGMVWRGWLIDGCNAELGAGNAAVDDYGG